MPGAYEYYSLDGPDAGRYGWQYYDQIEKDPCYKVGKMVDNQPVYDKKE
jgi:hypothetical protein